MSYSNILVAVAVTPESQQLLAKAVSIARPVKGHISLITLASDPEMYNQLAAPMLEDLRSVMQEETQSFLDKLIQDAGYPVDKTFIAYGELSEHILEPRFYVSTSKSIIKALINMHSFEIQLSPIG
ncbi:universal stress protein UspC [Escherichia coli]|uniref:universal stress protein UspC n=1 Tax=Escherichia coli TaxID=562 RepID=UPI003C6D288D